MTDMTEWWRCITVLLFFIVIATLQLPQLSSQTLSCHHHQQYHHHHHHRRHRHNLEQSAAWCHLSFYADCFSEPQNLSKANSAFHPSGVGKWVPASAGKAKAGMVHSVSGRMRGVQVKLWDPLRTCAIPEHLGGVIMTRRYTNLHLPLPLPLSLFPIISFLTVFDFQFCTPCTVAV